MRVLVRSIDSSLVDEWENAGTQAQEAANLAAPNVANAVVEDRRGLIVLIRNAMFRRVQLMDLDRPDELGALDKAWHYDVHTWEDVLDDFYDEHEYVNTDAEARGGEYSDGDHDWAITGTVNLDATQESGEVVFTDYSVRDVVNDNDAATVKAQ